MHYSKRLTSYHREASGKIVLKFEDGSTPTCDILIGADGVKSTVRKEFLHEQALKATAEGRVDDAREIISSIDPVWTGYVVYRAMLSPEDVPEIKTPTQVDQSLPSLLTY